MAKELKVPSSSFLSFPKWLPSCGWRKEVSGPWEGPKKPMVGGGWTTHLKKMLVKMGIFPKFRGENKTCLKPPPRTFCATKNYCLLMVQKSGGCTSWYIYIYIGSWNPIINEWVLYIPGGRLGFLPSRAINTFLKDFFLTVIYFMGI